VNLSFTLFFIYFNTTSHVVGSAHFFEAPCIVRGETGVAKIYSERESQSQPEMEKERSTLDNRSAATAAAAASRRSHSLTVVTVVTVASIHCQPDLADRRQGAPPVRPTKPKSILVSVRPSVLWAPEPRINACPPGPPVYVPVQRTTVQRRERSA